MTGRLPKFLPLLSILSFFSCKTPAVTQGSDILNAEDQTTSPCPQAVVDLQSEPGVILYKYPSECVIGSALRSIGANFDEINATNPHFISPAEFRAYDANVAFTSDKLVLNGEPKLEDNLLKLSVRNLVGYRIHVDLKDPRYGEAWIGSKVAIKLEVKDWETIQTVVSSNSDQHFGAGNEDDRKRINTFVNFASAVSNYIKLLTTGLTFGQKPVDIVKSQREKLKNAISADLVAAAQNDPKLSDALPAGFESLAVTHTANGQIENNMLVLRITKRNP